MLEVVANEGFAFVPAVEMQGYLAKSATLSDWDVFADSWNNLEIDTFMADNGRYRKRRYGVYEIAADGDIVRQPHQPHYQTVDYNVLNGGVDRWFEPILPEIGQGISMISILKFSNHLFSLFKPDAKKWHVEVHQFRIEARLGEHGQPTPEGMHRDGHDYVLVLMIRRHNIASGVTTIHDLNHKNLGSFTLTHPFDAAIVDDHRVFHGVTAVTPLDPAQPAYRDVLVVTFRKK